MSAKDVEKSKEIKNLKDFILSKENIYLAIYSVNSYVFDPELLSYKDKKLLHNLSDPFNEKSISYTINSVTTLLNNILENETLFKCQVYFKPKKYENNKIIYRPIHTSNLISLIAMVALLNSLIYEVPKDFKQKLTLSNYSKLIPNNFYGNRVSKDPETLFKKWSEQYKEFTEKANEYYNTFYETKEYKYEVKLDLENFFPSVNPLLIYQLLIENAPVTLTKNEDNFKTLKTIIYKLLVCEATNINTAMAKKEYYKNDNISGNLTLGIPQGLPQSYFFGNICMIEISKLFNKTFPGKSVYYVDDSYIYTDTQINNEDDFIEKLKTLNNKIIKESQDYIKAAKNDNFINNKSITEFSYQIKVHVEGKSEYSDIGNSNYGGRFLHNLSREASQVGTGIFSTYSDEENISIYNRTIGLLDAIQKEIKLIENKENKEDKKDEIYKEKLERYYKFFKYRALKLNLKVKMELDSQIISNVFPSCNPQNIYDTLPKKVTDKNFTDLYKNDIWQSAISILISNTISDNDHNKIRTYIRRVIKSIYPKDLSKCSYLQRQFDDYLSKKDPIDNTSIIYETLSKKINKKLIKFSNLTNSALVEEFNDIVLKGIKKNDILRSFDICSEDFNDICVWVNTNSHRLNRLFLNSVYSKVFNISISDDLILNSRNREGITYGQLRTLIYLRNPDFDLNEFFKLNINIEEDSNQSVIDYSLLEVLDIFKRFVSNSKQIDDLVLVHRYTSDVWKNGAKHLYFYTLHNQEHAIDLIKNIVKIVNTFSYLKVSSYDYYLLFIACYFHDISMVKIASENDFLLDDDDSNKLATDFSIRLQQKYNVKKEMVKVYKDVDEFYEKKIRENHAKDSAEEIRTRTDLDFLDEGVREYVAEISQGHMIDTKDIYYVAGEAKDKLVSMKFDKILLRFADLLDMSKHRVTKPILLHNFDNISDESAFHWISHLLTNGYDLESSYKINNKNVKSSYLNPDGIEENVTLSIFVNLSQFSKLKSRNCVFGKIEDSSINNDGFEIELCDNNESCSSKMCNFLCGWFNAKNGYLIQEMNELKSYLRRVPAKERFYKTDIKIKVIVQNPTNIPDSQLEILQKKLGQ